MIYEVNNLKELISLFPKTPEQIENITKICLEKINKSVDQIINLKTERNFANTAKAIDDILYFYGPTHATLHALEILSPEKEMRAPAQKQAIILSNNFIDKISTNIELYKAFEDYYKNIASKENLNKEQRHFVDETMKDFQKSGLNLPKEKLGTVRSLNKKIIELCLKFESNIATHKCEVVVSLAELEGMDKNFIDSLKKDKDGNYILGCDYPTFYGIIDNCSVESTRKRMYLEFNNRAYPTNMQLLDELIEKRDTLAKLIGYKSYAHMAIDGQMAKSPENVEKFLNNLLDKAIVKAQKERDKLKSDLPVGVELTKEGKIKPWDSKYIKNYYKKKYLNLDEQKISEYFPMDNTIKQLLNIYEKFLDIKLEDVEIAGLWNNDLRLIQAFDNKTNQLLGYMVLDLFPRDNKFNHAAHTTIIHSINAENKKTPYVGVVIANFPKPTESAPSLLKFKDVSTFFHEFGHAIHALLGATALQSFSGTNVKMDFVEMPSQMLEDWLADKDILKMVSKHYKTGEPLPEEIINKIIELDKFDSGDFVLTQLYYSLMSLQYYLEGAKKDTQAISQALYTKILTHLEWQAQNHMQASFGHLMGYGPSYYGYMWSKVFAKDLFSEINKAGLLDPRVGKKYIDQVIGKGGSQEPSELIKAFLGREPNEDAFMKSLGF